MSKLMIYNNPNPPGDWALLERGLNFWGAARDGSKRVKGFPNDAAAPANSLYTLLPVTGNMRLNWLEGAYFLDTDGYAQLARWDYANNTFVVGPKLNASDIDGVKLKPLSITQAGMSALFVVCHDGSIAYWDGAAATFAPSGDSALWLTRTPTEALMNDPGMTHYGWGFDGDLYSVLDTLGWDGATAMDPLFTTYTTSPAALAHANDPPGFGGFWQGRAVWVEKVGGEWYGLWRGKVWGDLYEPAPSQEHQFAVNALLKCVGGNPASYAAWHDTNAFLAPFAPYNITSEVYAFSTSIETENQQVYWREHYGDTLYFWTSPQAPGSPADFSAEAVHYLSPTDHGTSLSYPTANCYGGPFCVADTLYVAMILADTGTLRLYRLDTAPDGWSSESETALDFVALRIVSMFALNGYIHIALQSLLLPSDGDGAATHWEVMTYRHATGEWRKMQAYYPPPYGAASDISLVAKMFEARGYGAPAPGGGGGGGISGGFCDTTFSIYGPPTVSRAVFADHLAADGSPLLGEHTADYWYDLITGYGIDPNFFLAVIHHESQCGSVPGEVGFAAHNPGNLRLHSWGHGAGAAVVHTVCCGDFVSYPSYQYAIEDWCNLWGLSIYDGLTISQAMYVYAPPSENDTVAYINGLCTFLAAHKAASGP
jgi:hypothetical protein